MSSDREALNRFFVSIFNKILACEESALEIDQGDISVNEIHILEAVSNLVPKGQNTMKELSAALGLSPAAVSVAVNTLVKKGYLTRKNGEHDRRKVYIFATEKAEEPNRRHRAFHENMIDAIEKRLDEKELTVLTKSLEIIGVFFESFK